MTEFYVKHGIGKEIATTRFAEQALVAAPPRGPRFTMSEWHLSNNLRSRNTEDQQQLADRVLCECERIRDETLERSEVNKLATDRRLDERIGDVEFNANELKIIRKEVCLELEALAAYKTRIQDCLKSIEQNALTICRKCLIMRDGRVGIDLVVDEVDIALQREITVILGAQALLMRALEQANEQMRRLRSTRYSLDRDLHHKERAIAIDKGASILKNTDRCLSVYEGFTNLDPCNITIEEWNEYTDKSIEAAAKEVTSSRPIKVYVDTLLKQVIEDLWEAYEKCNHAFSIRIAETKKAKAKLEEMHAETIKKIEAMNKNIIDIQEALVNKQMYIALAHTRLGRRAARPGAELVCDGPGQSLLKETALLRMSVEQLQQAMAEAQASLRYLLQTQIQMEEDINVKMNSLKIDEVDCMTLRASMDYHSY